MRSDLRIPLFLAAALARGAAGAAEPPSATLSAPRPPEVAGVVPGTTLRAEVVLRLGEPASGGPGGRQVFAAPASLDGARTLAVDYFADDRRVAAVEVELVRPIEPQALAERVGRRVHQETDERGRLRETFFPSLLGLVHAGASAGTPVASILYLSPRAMSEVFVRRAESAVAAGDATQAMDEADKAVLVSPEYAGGYRARASVLQKSGQAEASLAQLLAAAAAPIGRDEQVRALALTARAFHERGWKDRAYAALADAEKRDPTAAAPYLAEAELKLEDGQKDAALAALTHGVERAPEDVVLRRRAADLLWEQKHRIEAAPHYLALIGHDASDERVLQVRSAYGLAEAGKHGEAIPHYERAIALKSEGDGWAHSNLGECYLKVGKAAEALARFDEAVRQLPAELRPARNRASALIRLGRADEARRALEELRRRHPGEAVLMVDLACAAAALGDRGKALDWIEKALKAGYRDVAYLRSTPDLEAVRERSRARFDKLVGAV